MIKNIKTCVTKAHIQIPLKNKFQLWIKKKLKGCQGQEETNQTLTLSGCYYEQVSEGLTSTSQFHVLLELRDLCEFLRTSGDSSRLPLLQKQGHFFTKVNKSLYCHWSCQEPCEKLLPQQPEKIQDTMSVSVYVFEHFTKQIL